jgi:hypothetical protein
VVRGQAERFFFGEFEKLSHDACQTTERLDAVTNLRNLITAMGETFHKVLLSNRSERRVFSIALSNQPDEEVEEVLRLGVQQGYLHEATIGNKEGTGRTRLYILNRMLAPLFTLDPTSFAGYLFVTNEALREAMSRSKPLRNLDEEDVEVEQLTLFE